MRDRRRREPARRDVERHVPRVVRPRRLHQPDLADDLASTGGAWRRCHASRRRAATARHSCMRPHDAPPPRRQTRRPALDKQAFGRLRQPLPMMLVISGLLQERIAELVPDRRGRRLGRSRAHPRRARGAQPARRQRACGPRPRLPRRARRPAAVGIGPGPRRPLPLQRHRVARVDVRRAEGARRLRQRELPLQGRGAALPAREQRVARDRLPRRLRADCSPRCATSCPSSRHLIQVADDSGEPLLPGAVDYEAWVAAASDALPDLPYSPDDLYVLYTGGTTGMPKGVLWRHEDVFFNGLGGHLPGFARLETEEKLASTTCSMGIGGRSLICLPFMHGAGQWGVVQRLPPRRHRRAARRDAAPRRRTRSGAPSSGTAATPIMMTGDGVARPLLAALREGHATTSSSIRVVTSTAAVLSPRGARRAARGCCPTGLMLIESLGASEIGPAGDELTTPRAATAACPPTRCARARCCCAAIAARVLRAGRPTSSAGSRPRGHLPLGYLGDPEKTRADLPGRSTACATRSAATAARWLRRRAAALPRTRVDVHQHRRREGVRRGGRAHRSRATRPSTTRWSSARRASAGASR